MTKYPNLTIGDTPHGDKVSLPMDALKRHMIALGSSGSGKTVLCKVMVEECVRSGLPVIALDPQGDLASLALSGDVNELVKHGVDPKIARQFFDIVDVKIWTPGSTYGIPLSIAPCLNSEGIKRPEDKIRAFGAIGANLAGVAGYKDEAASAAFSAILEYADTHEMLIEDLEDFIAFLTDPPMPLADLLDPVFDDKARARAARGFRVKLLGANRLLFDLGKPIDIDKLYGYEPGGANDNGKVRLSIVYLNTLNTQDEKDIFVAMLASSMYQWMLKEPSEGPVGLFYIDEVAPYMPPTRKPACKPGLMLLLTQARKYGICCLLATQSPGQIDYMGLGQVGTWALGKMSTPQEARKIEPSLAAQAGAGVAMEIIESLPGLQCGRFYLVNADHFDGPMETQVRWLVTDHKVLSADEIEKLVSANDRVTFG